MQVGDSIEKDVMSVFLFKKEVNGPFTFEHYLDHVAKDGQTEIFGSRFKYLDTETVLTLEQIACTSRGS